jgi:RNA polymerase sigma-70 factor (ECF subfamily)
MHTTPVSLLERLRDRNATQAWEQFVELYTPLLILWAGKLGVSEQEKEDLVQDVFVALVRYLPEFQFDPSRRFRGWLWTVVVNCHRSRQRKARARPDAQTGITLPEPMDVDPSKAEEAEYLTHLLRGALRLLRRDFTETTWRVFEAVALEGRPAPEVAREMHLSVGAVHSARFRVMSRLRQELAHLID